MANQLSNIKVPILFEELITGRPARTDDETVNIIKDISADFIFRSVFRTAPRTDNYWSRYQTIISRLHQEIPGIHINASIGGSTLDADNEDDVLRQAVGQPITWEMALDPGKWNINKSDGTPYTKTEFQNVYGNIDVDGNLYSYCPDPTNIDFQNLLLSWVKNLQNCGADSVWIDQPYTPASNLMQITNRDHISVKETYEAVSTIFEKVKAMGLMTGSWRPSPTIFRYKQGPMDFITDSVINREIVWKKIDVETWNTRKSDTKNLYGDIPHFAFIDWGAKPYYPMFLFSQIDKSEQKQILDVVGKYLTSVDIKFIWPIHGGEMVRNKRYQSFGTGGLQKYTTSVLQGYNIYDALAPEFETYDYMKQLISDIILSTTTSPPTTSTTTTTKSETSPLIVSGILIGGLYLLHKYVNKDN